MQIADLCIKQYLKFTICEIVSIIISTNLLKNLFVNITYKREISYNCVDTGLGKMNFSSRATYFDILSLLNNKSLSNVEIIDWRVM